VEIVEGGDYVAHVRFVLRTGVGLIFLIASLSKMRDLAAFRLVVGDLGLLPARFAGPVATGVVYTELLIGVFLVLGLYTRSTLAATCVLVFTFIAAIGIPLLQGRQVQCGCFGGNEYATAGTVARQMVLLGAAIVARSGRDSGWRFALDDVLSKGRID
jgi:uncharacterized membrane protein YphA (DoxX/SURF4 family)